MLSTHVLGGRTLIWLVKVAFYLLYVGFIFAFIISSFDIVASFFFGVGVGVDGGVIKKCLFIVFVDCGF